VHLLSIIILSIFRDYETLIFMVLEGGEIEISKISSKGKALKVACIN